MRVCVFEDDGVANLEPLTLTRPAFDLRCGAATLLERQLRLFGPDGAAGAAAWVRPELADLCRLEHPELAVNDPGWAPSAKAGGEHIVLVNARWLPPPERPVFGEDAAPGGPHLPGFVGLVEGQVAYAVVPAADAEGLSAEGLARRLAGWQSALPQQRAGGALITYPWDLVEHNGAALEQDYQLWQDGRERRGLPEGVALVGPPGRVLLDPEARVEPCVLLDATRGPVLVDRGAVVQAFSRLEGPCYVGPQTHVLGARLHGGSLGPCCRIGGEVEACIVQGHSNKAHDGFLGHAYLGQWVNLGAGTCNSDLRNDYRPVRVRLAGREVDSGLLKVGCFLGDHVKSSIGSLMNTGTSAGPFAQLLAGGLLPRWLPAFSTLAHGRLRERADLGALFATAATVLARRGRVWTEQHADFFLTLFEQSAAERRQAVRDDELRHLRRAV
jgi:UDP-N-acetylglucosamine diphosphorylase/glucosamine-1-phosphate N-acetyltransferase